MVIVHENVNSHGHKHLKHITHKTNVVSLMG